MLRYILFVGFVISLSSLAGATPASAGKCGDFCEQNRCGHGVGDPARCMHVCKQYCAEAHPKGGQKKQ